MGRIRDWLAGRKKDHEAKSYSVQLIVGDDGFMVGQSFIGGTLYTVLTQAIWTYICVNRISQDIASFPAVIQTRDRGTNKWETNLDHDLNELLDRPYGTSEFAPRVNWQQSIATGVMRHELSGNQFYQKTVVAGQLAALGLYLVQLRANVDLVTGLFNSYSPENSTATIPADNVVNILHANPSSTWEGVSPTVANEQATRVNFSADRRNRYDLETRVKPGVVFKVESLFTMSDSQRDAVKTMLADTYEGATNQGKSLVIGDNVTIDDPPVHVVDDIPTKDANARDKVISSFGVSPPMVGVVKDIKYANLDKASRIQWSNCIKPRLLNIYGAINSQAIWPLYGRDTRMWFDVTQSSLGLAALGELADTAAKYQGLGWPAMQLNEKFDLQMPEFEGWDKPNMGAVIAGRVPGEGSGDPAPDESDDEDEMDETAE